MVIVSSKRIGYRINKSDISRQTQNGRKVQKSNNTRINDKTTKTRKMNKRN